MSAAAGTPIAVVCGQLGYGGAERQLAELAVRLGNRGFAPRVCCLGGSEEPYGPWLRERGVPVSRIPRRGGFDLTRALLLARDLRRQPVALVHSFLIDTNPYAWMAARLSGVGRVVASNRNVEFARGPLRARLDGLVLRAASAVVVNAIAVRDFTARRFAIAPERLSVIYNGVDLERFRPSQSPRRSGFRVGSVGRLEAQKNPDMLVDVALELSHRFPALEFSHLGDGPLRGPLERRAGAAVRFRGASTAVESFLADLDVFVLTSNREGCANVLLEAMAAGVPVVATDAGGAREIVCEGETGHVVAREDRAAMVARVAELLAEPERRELMGGAARRRAESRFSIERMVDDMAGLYRRLLAADGGGA